MLNKNVKTRGRQKRSAREVRKGRRSIRVAGDDLKNISISITTEANIRVSAQEHQEEMSPGRNRSPLDFINSLSMSKALGTNL